MRREITGRRVLITGASTGIGRALTLVLAAKGARLAIAARTEQALTELADTIEQAHGRRPAVLVADLSQRGNAADLATRALDALGGVDILINNAGIGMSGYQWNVADRDEGREVFETNVWSPMALIGALVPLMRDRNEGTVVNLTSLMMYRNWPGLGNYAASKAALSALTETLRLELVGSDVRVLEATPGPVDTPILAEVRHSPGSGHILKSLPIAKPEEVAEAIADALETGRERLIVPRRLTVAAYLPGLVRFKAMRQVRGAAHDIDLDDDRVRRSGSTGDPVARAAREEWEQEHGAVRERI